MPPLFGPGLLLGTRRSRVMICHGLFKHTPSLSTPSLIGFSFLPGGNLCLSGRKVHSLLSTSNFIAMYSPQSSAIATWCIIFPILAILATVLRVYAQHSRSNRTLKPDDYVLFCALVSLPHGSTTFDLNGILTALGNYRWRECNDSVWCFRRRHWSLSQGGLRDSHVGANFSQGGRARADMTH